MISGPINLLAHFHSYKLSSNTEGRECDSMAVQEVRPLDTKCLVSVLRYMAAVIQWLLYLSFG